ncbi:MAG: SAM-dependent methyltransferase, partial [Candidatus Thiodiazotropha sp. (ex Lucinoma borealis)]|nr:SAM-dependent methyltransferase [Candidatus Thiodiazotropha sp. (ex Lucinoma borealis)]
ESQLLRQQIASARSLHELLFELITTVAQSLRDSGVLSISRDKDEVLPLVGRAVFARFLIDRGIINARTFPQLYEPAYKPELAFSTPELASKTCKWLDDKFNGELLPLLMDSTHPGEGGYFAFFSQKALADSDVLHQLTNVMYRAPNGRLSLDLAWDGIDFSRVPVGLLSEVYEEYAHQFYPDDALRESVRYTPRHIAEFTVAHAFEGLPDDKRSKARVLDPAAGAGIFLVLTLQRLVAERWRATGKRPDTQDIRQILNQQIRGFDINHSALTLAALSLYLTALELDPNPFPPEKLRFDRLLGSVLHDVRTPNEKYPYKELVLGSLGELGDLGKGDTRFDIVTGNPPWTSFSTWGTENYNFNHYVQDMVKCIVAAKRQGNEALQEIAQRYMHNDKLPDTAFMWRALEWAKEGGVIAFIVAGRLLFKRGDIGGHVRDALLQSMQVTGILNGALLMPLWPKINQPFCIVFARNQTPTPGERFTLVTPTLDTGPAGQNRMRVDAEARQPIDLQSALERPYLFKVLTRGGRLDVDIVEKIRALNCPTNESSSDKNDIDRNLPSVLPISEYWYHWNNQQKRFGQGYIPVGKKTNKQTETTRLRISELLRRESLTLTADDLVNDLGDIRIGLNINPRQLSRFTALKLYRLADPDIFNPPLVLVKEGFGESPAGIRARLYLGKKPVVFRRNFYGFSCAGHPKAKQMAKYLFCIINSDLFGYYTLQASAKFGLERRTLLVEDIENFPIFHALTDRQFDEIEKVADELTIDNAKSWCAMNRVINRLYGLSPADQRVMKDTLETMMPYKAAEARSRASATRQEIKRFIAHVGNGLQPLFEPDEEEIEVTEIDSPGNGWVVFDVKSCCASSKKDADLASQIATDLADQEGASRIFHRISTGWLRVTIRNQYRYLTPSRARLCSIDILRDHGVVFPIKDDA